MNKVSGLMDRLKRVKSRRGDDMEIDPLSASMYAFIAELAALDDAGIAAYAKENDMTEDIVRRMILDYTGVSR